MKIGFIDFVGWDYDVETPYVRPLAESQSGLAYLAAAMAARGHEVTLFTHTTDPGVKRGVFCRSLEGLSEADIRSSGFEALIVLNAAEALEICLKSVGTGASLILWAQQAADQPTLESLSTLTSRLGWNGVACCSEFHRRQFVDAFHLDGDRMVNLGNAIAPDFEAMFKPDESISLFKSKPVLAYTAAPYRGLSYLLKAFPEIKARLPGANLKVCCDMSGYDMSAEEDPYTELYEQCRHIEGVDYLGALPPLKLAEVMREVKVLAYPNTYVETQGVGVMEAMVAGAHVVTSAYGALPEVCHGYADLIPMTAPDSYLRQFVDGVVAALTREADEKALRAHRQYFLDRHTWAQRARAWEDWLRQ